MSGAGDEAFIRLLADANAGGQSRVDALLALSQRTLFVPTWLPGDDAFRTVVSSAGVAALPVFATIDSIEATSRRFGWTTPDGRVPYREVGARGALGHALAQNLLVIVEMGAPHALELDQDEIRPLVSGNRRDASGPFATSGKVTSAVMAAVRERDAKLSSIPPPPDSTVSSQNRALTPMPAPQSPIAGPRATRTPSVYPLSTAPISIGDLTLSNLTLLPTDALLDGLTEVLRSYPEVEWACLAMMRRAQGPEVPACLLRIDGGFRARVDEIVAGVKSAVQKLGAELEVVLLDDAAVTRAARSVGKPFYPWRK